MLLNSLLARAILLVGIMTPVMALPVGDEGLASFEALKTLAGRQSTFCTTIKCSKRSDCTSKGCDNGCNTNGKCHKNVGTCPKGAECV